MANCEFCNSEIRSADYCENCGEVKFSSWLTFVYGQTQTDSKNCEIKLTDKYLLVKGEGGVYAFYDLSELDRVIYPYHTTTFKKDTALKFVNRDESDFVIIFNISGIFGLKAVHQFAEILAGVGVNIESDTNVFTEFCSKPFVDADTFSNRVCYSASAFIQLKGGQFAASPIWVMQIGGSTPDPITMNVPVPEPITFISEEPETQRILQSPSPSSDMGGRCYACGENLPKGAKFCGKCGTVQVQTSSQTRSQSQAQTAPENKCFACGERLPNGAKFCGFCGATQAGASSQAQGQNRCFACGENLPVGAKFCGKCGTVQVQSQSQTQSQNSCRICGESLPVGAKFCGRCGAVQTQASSQAQSHNSSGYIYCPRCGTAEQSGAAFCSRCGTQLKG